MNWLGRSARTNQSYKSLRQILKEHPNSGQVVIGDGTVHVSSEKIRASASYKELTGKLEDYVNRNHL